MSFLSELDVGSRALGALQKINPNMDLAYFMKLTEGRVMHVKGVGRKTWREIREMQEHFAYLAQDRPAEEAAEPLPAWRSPMHLVQDLAARMNNVLMDDPSIRLALNPDGSVTVCRQDERSAQATQAYRAWVQEHVHNG